MGEHLKKLRELRIAKGISQKELAEYLGITVASYSLYERGNREPNISILKKIAAYYGISVDELLELNDKPQTIAAHFDGDEYTEEELDKIKEYAAFIRMQRYKDALLEEAEKTKAPDEPS